MKSKFSNAVLRLLESRLFFIITLVYFIFQALWIAMSGRFSMPFDENTHLAIIRLYSEKLLPFWQTPPPPAGYGPVSVDPSYFYHYILSFPYRFFAQYAESLTAQVIFLRLFSIAFFVIGLLLVRKLFLRLGLSRALAHTLIFLLAAIPASSFLAAQINYDNLLFPATTLVILLTVNFDQKIRRNKLDIRLAGWIMAVCFLASVVMFAFVPVFLAIAVWMLFRLYGFVANQPSGATKSSIRRTLKKTSVIGRLALAIMLIVSFGLFFERYGMNTIRYGTPLPKCHKVLARQDCALNTPWLRGEEAYQQKLAGDAPAVNRNPLVYFAGTWLRIMGYQMFFSLNGQIKHFRVGAPLPVPFFSAIILAGAGALLFLFYFKKVASKELLLLLFIALVYFSFLFLKNYTGLLRLNQAFGIQARYLIPIMPIVFIAFGLAFRQALAGRLFLKAALAVTAIFIMAFQGGGATVYILRSDETWWWQNNVVISVNQKTQNLLNKFVIGG